jgi:hypothetical protein
MADPILSAHIEARRTALVAAHPQIDPAHYVDGVLQDRADRYAAHLATMVFSPAMVQWALAMSRQYGPWVKVHHFVADWLTALLIIRYGEEPDAARSSDPGFKGWPTSLTPEDETRASELLVGTRWSQSLTLLPKNPLSPEA